MRSRRLVLLVSAVACAALFVAAAADLQAGDDEKAAAKSKAKAAPEPAHLDYKRTYAEALREARIRNLPVFVSRHKDF